MGLYINPPNEDKKTYLQREGLNVNSYIDYNALFKKRNVAPINFGPDPTETTLIPVVLVGNGSFTAAAIAYSKDEWKAFTNPNDLRPRKHYLVYIAAILRIHPEHQESLAKYDWCDPIQEEGKAK